MIKPIVVYGAPILRKACLPVNISDPGLPALIRDLRDTMQHANGAGLAAPQINEDARIFVVQQDEHEGVIVFINPVITAYSDEIWLDEEGCLSVPGLQEPVPRALEITINWLDENLIPQSQNLSGPVARIIQHEYDHLEGRLYFDRLSPLRKRLLRKRLERIRKGQVSCPYPLRFTPR
ncbi:peptide deformylase [Chitinophaga sp. XS-30]|uniref:peptide deformylase n=1 Tax=Chitinophaga sp. XS-30 TaxID=2604421 RepID=UPI0011DCCC30|nr:peptide deformylase [Chitinophaga sp. XS-30]QEH41975.1 peptide deformylase [Chitinophaga sp. XS-30]